MPKKKSSKQTEKLRPVQRLSLYFFNRPRKTALLFLVVFLFGVVSYSTLLKREGFPPIETPFAISQSTYLVNDVEKVDETAARPLGEYLLDQPGVSSVQTQSFDNFFTAIVSYDENVDAEQRSSELQQAIDEQAILPEQVTGELEAFKFGYTERGDDIAISFFSTQPQDNAVLVAKAEQAAEFLNNQNLPSVESVSIINPFQSAENPLTGQTILAEKSFDRYGFREGEQNVFYDSVIIGVQGKEGFDALELDQQVRSSLEALRSESDFSEYSAVISASAAPQINAQIDELQRTLLEGLLAILIVGSLIIAIRASIITVLSLISVILITIGLLYLIDYSLNTITLFALILGLSLIVDDTIIMIEALDAQRRKKCQPKEAVRIATRKVSRAMTAATITAGLSFAPLIFIGGILGGFIRAIPITIISALAISLFVALVFIPLLAKFILFSKKQRRTSSLKPDMAAKAESKIADFISRPMLWAKGSTKKLASVSTVAILIGVGFIGVSGYIFQQVGFNIFPSTKDSNYLTVTTSFAPDTPINEARSIASEVEKQTADIIGSELVQASYYAQANERSAVLSLELTDYKERDPRSTEYIDKLKAQFADYPSAQVSVSQLDAGPPPSPFTARIDSSENREAALKLADDMAVFLKSLELERRDGTKALIESVTSANPSQFSRSDNQAFVTVTAFYEDDDTTTLVTLTQTALENEFPPDRIESYGLSGDSLSFDFGQETENQDSFASLALAFPVVLLAIYIVLAFQFKSFLQPLLIFMAIPFSLFGVTLGLYLTDNPFSFFAMLGFFALIGLSIKNTILLTDYANQALEQGMHPVNAMHSALTERFRPLLATSLTAVVSLIPLAITSPFWEGLAVVLIFGLLSSTLLVLTVFPYYFLAAEFLRRKTNRAVGKLYRRLRKRTA